MKKSLLTIVGFLLFGTGLLGLILNLVGLRLSIFSFLESSNALLGLLVKIIFMMAGIVIVYVIRTSESDLEA